MSLALPRTLVVELLHRAQTASGAVEGVVLRDTEGKLLLGPSAAGGTAFACYRSTPAEAAPTSADMERCRRIAPVLLQVALGTRGVLQLRAWDLTGDTPRPLELELTEAAVQGNGNSNVA